MIQQCLGNIYGLAFLHTPYDTVADLEALIQEVREQLHDRAWLPPIRNIGDVGP